jgi:hypothetical protein
MAAPNNDIATMPGSERRARLNVAVVGERIADALDGRLSKAQRGYGILSAAVDRKVVTGRSAA